MISSSYEIFRAQICIIISNLVSWAKIFLAFTHNNLDKGQPPSFPFLIFSIFFSPLKRTINRSSGPLICHERIDHRLSSFHSFQYLMKISSTLLILRIIASFIKLKKSTFFLSFHNLDKSLQFFPCNQIVYFNWNCINCWKLL